MMNKLNYEIFFIKAMNDKYIDRVVKSFYRTLLYNMFIYHVIEEKNTREETLNQILKLRDKTKDLFIVADDIVFLPNWYEDLVKYYSKGDVIGFSMLFPGGKKIQDFGYDFIKVDDELISKGLYKYSDIEDVTLPAFRDCHAINGCAMYIKKEVLDSVKEFSLDGVNRWGELIFCNEARRKGFKTIVLKAHLEHDGKSSKVNKNKVYSSISWLYERDLWKDVVKKYLCNVKPSKVVYRSITSNLKDIIMCNKFNVYGCGTIADYILKYDTLNQCKVYSSLEEEIGKEFHDKIILDIKDATDEVLLITPIGYDKEILATIPDRIKESNQIYGITEREAGEYILYDVRYVL